MARRLMIAAGIGVGAYVVGAFLSGWLVMQLSSNTHDRSVEAAMSGAFVFGPLAALAGFVSALVFTARRAR